MHYCLDCTWRTNTDERRTDDSDRRAIDHHVATGHTVVHRSTDRSPNAEDEPNPDRSTRSWLLAPTSGEACRRP